MFIRMAANFPRHIVWSTDKLDPRDPFQRRCAVRQHLTHGTAQDIGAVDPEEIKK
jgi:hypothetical protein